MTRRTVAALLAVAVALGACGGGPSKEEFANELDRVCRDLEAQTAKIGQVEPTTPAQLNDQLGKLRGTLRDAVARMRDIERPDGEDGEKAERYVDEVEHALENHVFPALDELEAAIRAKDDRKIRAAAAELEAIDEHETQRLAEELGADDCAENRSV
jgi:hypothetical protein